MPSPTKSLRCRLGSASLAADRTLAVPLGLPRLALHSLRVRGARRRALLSHPPTLAQPTSKYVRSARVREALRGIGLRLLAAARARKDDAALHDGTMNIDGVPHIIDLKTGQDASHARQVKMYDRYAPTRERGL